MISTAVARKRIKLLRTGSFSQDVELEQVICPNDSFRVSLQRDDEDKVILRLLDIHPSHTDEAKKWVADNCIRLSSLGIDNVQFILPPIPVLNILSVVALAPTVEGGLKILEKQVETMILSFLQDFEENPPRPTMSFNAFLSKEAHALGLIHSVERYFGDGGWERLVKKALIGTGRYREDTDGAVVIMS